MVTCEREVLARDGEESLFREVEEFLAQHSQGAYLVGPSGTKQRLPVSLYTVLQRVAHELASGNAVTVVPIQAELTTQQAADLLNVSRPFLIKLLGNGEIPYHFVGTHRRITFRDLAAYRNHRDAQRANVLAEMAREAQELGMYE